MDKELNDVKGRLGKIHEYLKAIEDRILLVESVPGKENRELFLEYETIAKYHVALLEVIRKYEAQKPVEEVSPELMMLAKSLSGLSPEELATLKKSLLEIGKSK